MTNNDLPNKCDSCGLMQTFPPDTNKLFVDIRKLFDNGIIKKKFIRYIKIGDRTEFCLISHPAWGPNSKKIKCDKWQLDVGLPKSDVLGINLADETSRLTKKANRLAFLAVCLGILSIAISLAPQIRELTRYLIRLIFSNN